MASLIRPLLLLMVLCVPTLTSAQTLADTKGTDFWLAFPPNDHPSNNSSPQLAVFISADRTANVTIYARDLSGQTDTIRRTVQAGTILQERFTLSRFELRGTDFLGSSKGDCERPMPASIHVTSDEDVTVYALSRELNTSDAWIVLPTDVLGTTYRVMSYPSDARADTVFFLPILRDAYPGQFVIVATEDNTEIELSLRLSITSAGIGRERTITLDRGQSYLLQANVTLDEQHDDLTGSLIRSTKPICVISGHFRAQVPLITEAASRDFIAEQLPSVDTWGKNYVIGPLALPSNYQKQGQTDVTVIRILAHTDSTMVSLDGLPAWRLDEGDIWELPLSRPRTVVSNQPVLVGIIDRSANRGGQPSLSGDPSLTIVPPVEQFLADYRMVSIEPQTTNPFYTDHYLMLTVPLAAEASIRVDENPIDSALRPILATAYGYANVPVTAGTHAITCDSTFGIVAYGYGPAESYGYTGGMAFEKLYQPTVVLRVLDTASAPGAPTDLIVVVDSLTEAASFAAMRVRRVELTLDYDRTVFVPNIPTSPSLDQRGNIRLEATFDSLQVGDTLIVLGGRAVLGVVAVDTISITSAEWFDDRSMTTVIATTSRRGVLTITDLCDANGARLFDPLAAAPPIVRYYDLLGRELDGPSREVMTVRVTQRGSHVTSELLAP